MANLHWESQGEGQDVVLIHGWGMNGAIWKPIIDTLSVKFRVHTVDLPGYGFSHEQSVADFDDLCQQVVEDAPEKAVYIGWSLGGLTATNIALKHPERVEKLITVASSPKFAAEKGWKGILPKVMTDLAKQLVSGNFKLTIEGFMMLQALGSPSAIKDVKLSKKQVFSRPLPNPDALKTCLDILANEDLRSQLSDLKMPFLRLYGRLDGLVPKKVATAVEPYAPNSEGYVFKSSSHAPFMTEHDLFCEMVEEFIVRPAE